MNPILENSICQAALDVAIQAHGDQVDKSGEPYWTHLARTANYLITSFPDASIEEVVASIFHDLLEDTDATVDDIKIFCEENGISDVSNIVLSVTRVRGPELTYLKWIKSIVAESGISAIRVKLSDISDNIDRRRMKKLKSKIEALTLRKRYSQAKKILERKLKSITAQAPHLTNQDQTS